jgi:mono/diheme cytochrome c family protein
VVRSAAISRLLAGTGLAFAFAACSGEDAESQRSPVLPPLGDAASEPAERPPAEQIARAAASDPARAPNDVDWSGGDAAHGQALFAEHCAICHGGGGAGDGIATPALNPKPRDFTDGRFYLDADANNQTGEDVDLARVIQFGPAAFGGSNAMTPWKDTLSEGDVRDLVAHIRTLAHAGATG